jgi:hypothetical protein
MLPFPFWTKRLLLLSLLAASGLPGVPPARAQEDNFSAVRAEVDFSYPLRPWDGFGFNYVQTAQTYDYAKNPQDYGGFTFLKEAGKRAILELVFGKDGLQPGLVKMFLDPLHQTGPGSPYDHVTTTGSMRYFVKEGLKITRQRGGDLSVLTTLYAPPAYVTRQQVMRGRDLDPARKADLARYMIDWVKFLKEGEKLPVKYVSIHNEGESWLRWPQDGTSEAALAEGHDYNFFWTPEQTVEVINLMRPMLDGAGLEDVGITNGEYTNWYRFYHWGFARRLAGDKQALQNLALVTSHGFYVGGIEAGRWYGPHSNLGTDLLREKKPGLHAWVTSTAWNIFDNATPRNFVMDAHFIKEMYGNIYEAKVNGIIPWAGIQNHSQWRKPDPNPGTAIRVYDDGTYEVPKAYYFYKQVCRAGQTGMAVAYTAAMDSEFSIIAFARNGTAHPNAFVVTHTGKADRKIVIEVTGASGRFKMYRTSGSEKYVRRDSALPGGQGAGDNYAPVGSARAVNGKITYLAPAGSVTTFYEE